MTDGQAHSGGSRRVLITRHLMFSATVWYVHMRHIMQLLLVILVWDRSRRLLSVCVLFPIMDRLKLFFSSLKTLFFTVRCQPSRAQLMMHDGDLMTEFGVCACVVYVRVRTRQSLSAGFHGRKEKE